MPIDDSFSYESALDQSMLLFWSRGYFNCSISDITKTTGLNRVTIYKEFGGKEGFFLAMLQRYRDKMTSQLFKPLQDDSSGLNAIYNFFDQFIELSESGQLQQGCFFIATATDLPSHPPAIQKTVNVFIEQLTTLFTQAIKRAKMFNEISQTLDSDTTATFFVANIFGLLSLARATNNNKLVRDQVTMLKQWLSFHLK